MRNHLIRSLLREELLFLMRAELRSYEKIQNLLLMLNQSLLQKSQIQLNLNQFQLNQFQNNKFHLKWIKRFLKLLHLLMKLQFLTDKRRRKNQRRPPIIFLQSTELHWLRKEPKTLKARLKSLLHKRLHLLKFKTNLLKQDQHQHWHLKLEKTPSPRDLQNRNKK